MSVVENYINTIPPFLSDLSGNTFRQTFFSDFLDVNGNLIIRNGNINVFNGLVSLMGNLYLMGNVISYSNISQQTIRQNISLGANALKVNTGNYNSAFGDYSLLMNTTGIYNTAVGEVAGSNNITGSYNTFIGSSADVASSYYSYSTAIGYGAKIISSNQIVLGTKNETVYFPGNSTYGVIYVGNNSQNGNALLSGNIGIYNTVLNDNFTNNSLNFINNNGGDFIIQSNNSSSGYLTINNNFYFNKNRFGIANNTYINSDYDFTSNNYNLYVLGNSIIDPGVRFILPPIMPGSGMASFLSNNNALGIGINSLNNYYLKTNTTQFIYDVYSFGVNSTSNIGSGDITNDILYDDQNINYLNNGSGLFYKHVSFGTNSSNKLSRTLITTSNVINSGTTNKYLHPYGTTIFGSGSLVNSFIARKISLFGNNSFPNGDTGYYYDNNNLYYTHIIGFGTQTLNSAGILIPSNMNSSIIAFGNTSLSAFKGNLIQSPMNIVINSFGNSNMNNISDLTKDIYINSFGFNGSINTINGSNNNNSFGSNSLAVRIGSYNNYFGNNSGGRTQSTVSFNNAFGYYSLYSNTTNGNNIAFGYNSLYSSTTGRNNIAFGYNSLYSATTGGNNIAFGYNSLYSHTTGGNNIAFGQNSLYSNTLSENNIAFGGNVLYFNKTGNNNIGLGSNSAINNNSGFNNNIYIGSNTGILQSSPFLNSIGNSLCLGYGSVIDNVNQVVLGTSIGNVYVPGSVYVNGPIYAKTTVTSDYRIKKNIMDLDENFVVDNLKPVIYYNILSKSDEIGFIAHEIQKEYPYLVNGEKDDPYNLQSLNYGSIIPININEIKNLKKKINVYKEKIKTNYFIIEQIKEKNNFNNKL